MSNFKIPEVGGLYRFRQDKRYFQRIERAIFNTKLDGEANLVGYLYYDDLFVFLELESEFILKLAKHESASMKILTLRGLVGVANIYLNEIYDV